MHSASSIHNRLNLTIFIFSGLGYYSPTSSVISPGTSLVPTWSPFTTPLLEASFSPMLTKPSPRMFFPGSPFASPEPSPFLPWPYFRADSKHTPQMHPEISEPKLGHYNRYDRTVRLIFTILAISFQTTSFMIMLLWSLTLLWNLPSLYAQPTCLIICLFSVNVRSFLPARNSDDR